MKRERENSELPAEKEEFKKKEGKQIIKEEVSSEGRVKPSTCLKYITNAHPALIVIALILAVLPLVA